MMKANWETKSIEEVTARLIDYRGKTPPKTDSGVRLITAKVVKGGRIIEEKPEFIASEFYDEWMRRGLPKQWDLLITTEAPLGEVALLRTPERIALAQRIILLRGNPDIVDQRYYFYALQSEFTQGELNGRGTGTTVLGIKQSELRKVLVKLPDLPTQRKIAGILSAYDDLIENNLRRIKILEQMAQSLYREWFVHFRFPRDPSEASAKAGGHESATFKDSELGRIPDGWEVKKLTKIADINAMSLRAANAPEEIHYIDIASVSTGSIDKIDTMTFDAAPSRARRIVRHGDIIWSTVRPNRRSFSLIIDPAENVIASTGFAVLSARSVPWSYLYQATTTEDFTSYLVNHASGAAYPAVNAGIFENADIVVPPTDLLKRFNAMAEPTQVLEQNLVSRNQTLRRTRDLLLPKLLSGGDHFMELETASSPT